AYAYARVGYHRGLDALRAAGWRGAGPIPYAHEVNRGFLRALYALGRAAGAIGEGEEAARIEEFLASSDPTAAEAIGKGECGAVRSDGTASRRPCLRQRARFATSACCRRRGRRRWHRRRRRAESPLAVVSNRTTVTDCACGRGGVELYK